MKTDPDAPAYPIVGSRYNEHGLTKREAMAMHICAGMMANPDFDMGAARVTKVSVEFADALIAALNAELEGE